MEMPNPLVRNLRDIRIKQLEARRKEAEQSSDGGLGLALSSLGEEIEEA